MNQAINNDHLVVNFYKFVELADVEILAKRMEQQAAELGLLGTILLATEGINASLYGKTAAINTFGDLLRQDERFSDVAFKDSAVAATQPFGFLMVRVKPTILAFDPDSSLSVAEIRNGGRVSASEFHAAVKNPTDDVVIIDTRNQYEIDYGAFEGAKSLGIRHFRDFKRRFIETYGHAKDKSYYMYCTGGIRCEKAVAALQKEGFTGAKQLEGGIINYFKDIGADGFQGDCFVFDNRWAIRADLSESDAGPHPDQKPRKTNFS